MTDQAISVQAGGRAAAIVAAAYDVFGQLGYRRVVMADLARAAGLSRAAIYLHFPNKAAVCAAVVRTEHAAAAGRMAQALAPGLPPATALGLALAARGDRLDRLPADGDDPLILAAQSDGRALLAATLAGWIGAEIAAGRLAAPGRAPDPLALARVILAAAGAAAGDDIAIMVRLIGRGLAV
jgi:AcrR family transcriptional regulator